MADGSGGGRRGPAGGLCLGDVVARGQQSGDREVDFTNTANAPCGLYGYPGVSFVTSGDGAAHQIGAAAQQNAGFGKVAVRLAAGGVAHAWLQVSQAANYPSATCQPVTAHWLRVYAPGQTQAPYVNQSFSACSPGGIQLLTVMPVRPGQGVQGSTP